MPGIRFDLVHKAVVMLEKPAVETCWQQPVPDAHPSVKLIEGPHQGIRASDVRGRASGSGCDHGAIDQSWQVLLSHIQRSAFVPFAVPQLTLSSTIPLFSTTSS
jgi:hypothetical protein